MVLFRELQDKKNKVPCDDPKRVESLDEDYPKFFDPGSNKSDKSTCDEPSTTSLKLQVAFQESNAKSAEEVQSCIIDNQETLQLLQDIICRDVDIS